MTAVHDNLIYINYFFSKIKHQGSKALDIKPSSEMPELLKEDIGEYVAQLQLHMALQARNLVPTFTTADINSSRHQMLQEAQAAVEKLASRQSL